MPSTHVMATYFCLHKFKCWDVSPIKQWSKMRSMVAIKIFNGCTILEGRASTCQNPHSKQDFQRENTFSTAP